MDFTALFLATTLSLALPPKLLDSVCYIESAHRPDAVNPHDGSGPSYGICQVKATTCAEMGIEGDLLDPVLNVACAGKYLAYQIKRYSNVKRGVCAYNRGYSAGDGNSKYTRKVYREWGRRLHG